MTVTAKAAANTNMIEEWVTKVEAKILTGSKRKRETTP